ncbi:11435_t:CDS:1, partial [Dentiscutata erythropus]
ELAEGIRYSNINEFEDYSAPNIDYENESQPRLRIPYSFDDILIWLLKFQSNFKVPETAIEILIKYIHQLLCEFGDENLFKDFSTSMYMLRKHLKISNFITYSVCLKCDKLYTKKEVVDSWDNNGQLS